MQNEAAETVISGIIKSYGCSPASDLNPHLGKTNHCYHPPNCDVLFPHLRKHWRNTIYWFKSKIIRLTINWVLKALCVLTTYAWLSNQIPPSVAIQCSYHYYNCQTHNVLSLFNTDLIHRVISMIILEKWKPNLTDIQTIWTFIIIHSKRCANNHVCTPTYAHKITVCYT